MSQLPFPWAKTWGAQLCEDEAGVTYLLYRPDCELTTLLEVCRSKGQTFPLRPLTDEQFEQALVDNYQQDSSQARKMMEDLGNELDFYSLAENLPANGDLLENEDDAPIIRLINAMLAEAIKEGASDIHIEPFEQNLAIRFRVDGVLRKILQPQRALSALLVSRIKVMAKLDIAEKRIPQDGRIALRIGGRAVDVRVSTLPSNHGERVVMRLLDKNSIRLDYTSLGLDADVQQKMKTLVANPHGIILVTGPTGSGKSTTLYATLTQISSDDRNIMTIEDPIEFDLPGIGQTQVNAKVDMTFARGLRALLRQDPDVVLIGEIRDSETAQIAVQASLTGHLVLSTLHTNTAIGAIARLQDMGVEPFLLSNSLLGVLSQRLVRRLCPACCTPHHFSVEELRPLNLPDCYQGIDGYQPVGCEQCNNSGYRGRTGIHELLIVDAAVREAIHNGNGELAIERLVRASADSIRQNGLNKVRHGLTSLSEVLRTTREG